MCLAFEITLIGTFYFLCGNAQCFLGLGFFCVLFLTEASFMFVDVRTILY